MTMNKKMTKNKTKKKNKNKMMAGMVGKETTTNSSHNSFPLDRKSTLSGVDPRAINISESVGDSVSLLQGNCPTHTPITVPPL